MQGPKVDDGGGETHRGAGPHKVVFNPKAKIGTVLPAGTGVLYTSHNVHIAGCSKASMPTTTTIKIATQGQGDPIGDLVAKGTITIINQLMVTRDKCYQVGHKVGHLI